MRKYIFFKFKKKLLRWRVCFYKFSNVNISGRVFERSFAKNIFQFLLILKNGGTKFKIIKFK